MLNKATYLDVDEPDVGVRLKVPEFHFSLVEEVVVDVDGDAGGPVVQTAAQGQIFHGPGIID